MKKVAIIIIFLLLLSVTGAFAEDNVAVIEETWQAKREGVIYEDAKKTTQIAIPKCTGATKPQVKKIVDGLQKELLGDKKTGKKGAISEVKTVAQKAEAEARAAKNNAIAAYNNSYAAYNNSKTLLGVSRDQSDAIRTNTETIKKTGEEINWKLWVLIIICVAGFIGLGFFLFRKMGKIVSEVQKAAKAGAIVGINALDETLKKLPENTAKAVHEYFDSTPFTFETEIPGYKVTYNPAEGIARGIYQILYIPKDPDTNDPAAFQRLAKTSRGQAEYSILGSLKKVLGGKSNPNTPQGQLELALVDYLRKTGELNIVKIS